MRLANNFNPEWGYLAPAPGFVRIARVALVAAAVGASAGAAVVFSLIDHPAAKESSVAARTLVSSAQQAAAPDAAEKAKVLTAVAQSPARLHSRGDSRDMSTALAETTRLSTEHGLQGAAALAEAPVVSDAAPAAATPQVAGVAAPAAATPQTVAPRVVSRQKKVVRRQPPRVIWRNAPREQAYGNPYNGLYGGRIPPVALMPSYANRNPYLVWGED